MHCHWSENRPLLRGSKCIVTVGKWSEGRPLLRGSKCILTGVKVVLFSEVANALSR